MANKPDGKQIGRWLNDNKPQEFIDTGITEVTFEEINTVTAEANAAARADEKAKHDAWIAHRQTG